MPITTVAHALPFVNWIVLVSLAVGSIAFVALAGRLTDATRGYLGFTAFCAALLAGLALLADPAPAPDGVLAIGGGSPAFDMLRRAGVATVGAGSLAYMLLVRRAAVRDLAALAALGGGVMATGAAAFGWAPGLPDGVPLAIQLGLLALATGGSLAALVLGHWYLVTPRISERPLLLQARMLTVVVGTQLALFATWALFGGGPNQAPFETLTGELALFGWLRLLVGLLFPLALAAMAWATARTRSMESATGLLYIALAAVVSGTIGSAALYVGAGVLV